MTNPRKRAMQPPNPIDAPAAPLQTGPAVPDFDDGQTDTPSGVEDEAARCGSCGGFLNIDQAYSPNRCPLCNELLPPPPGDLGPAIESWQSMHAEAVRKAAATGPLKLATRQPAPSAGKSAHPWRRDEKFIEALSEANAKFVRVAIDRALKGHRDAIAMLDRRLKALEAENERLLVALSRAVESFAAKHAEDIIVGFVE